MYIVTHIFTRFLFSNQHRTSLSPTSRVQRRKIKSHSEKQEHLSSCTQGLQEINTGFLLPWTWANERALVHATVRMFFCGGSHVCVEKNCSATIKGKRGPIEATPFFLLSFFFFCLSASKTSLSKNFGRVKKRWKKKNWRRANNHYSCNGTCCENGSVHTFDSLASGKWYNNFCFQANGTRGSDLTCRLTMARFPHGYKRARR